MEALIEAPLPLAVVTPAGVAGGRRGHLAVALTQQLLERIESGAYATGERLPSQEDLCREFSVSRTVIREAVASLRQSGHLVVRQGAGVFVAQALPRALPFGSFAARDVATAIQILELRIAVEIEQAALAAERRTPTALANLTAAYDDFNRVDGSDSEALARADYRFHLAIAQATQNPQFVHFFQALGSDIFLDLRLKHVHAVGLHTAQAWIRHGSEQHGAILVAISIGNAELAREAVRVHLSESLARYRQAVAAADSSLIYKENG